MDTNVRAPVCRRAAEILLSLGLFCILLSCVPLFQGIRGMKDLQPPVYTGLEQPGRGSLILKFNEHIKFDSDDFAACGGFEISGIEQADQTSLLLALNGDDLPGEELTLEGRVRDDTGNELWFLLPFYSVNINPAQLILSEFITEHSSSRYEKAEIVVLREGNLGGITVYNGAAGDHKSCLRFQDQEVEQGEYLIVHFRSDGLAGETDEYGEDRILAGNSATAPNAIADVRDFWTEGDQGLSDTNGALSIYASPAPGAEILDAVLYSNRSYEEGQDYGSFGTSYTQRVMNELAGAGAWVYSGDQIIPEDCLRSEDSTSTRSICRDLEFNDTNGKNDWHIVPTSCSSFGHENCQDVYEP
ncbi:hypothetical protein [Salinispira pacifica]|nr:hypothetical protein [Salinispira pacifica]